MLTLQQAETVPEAPAPQPPAVYAANRLVAPVIPEDVPLQCRYSAEDQSWHCSYARWFREPSTTMVLLMGVMGLGLGFLIASFPPVREAIKTAKSVSPV
jgi:hypothetical protein